MAENAGTTNLGTAPLDEEASAATGRGTPLLQLKDVCVDYGKFRALTGVSYTIYPGR